jgi:hypothetical protein
MDALVSSSNNPKKALSRNMFFDYNLLKPFVTVKVWAFRLLALSSIYLVRRLWLLDLRLDQLFQLARFPFLF